jgi:hypothetical protein
MNTSSDEVTSGRKRRLVRFSAAALVAAVVAVTAAQPSAFADGPTYGTVGHCDLDMFNVVTAQPHFVQTGNHRQLDGYAYFTSHGLLVNTVEMDANISNTSFGVGRTLTSPNSSATHRTDLGRFYSPERTGTVTVLLDFINSGGVGCIIVVTV